MCGLSQAVGTGMGFEDDGGNGDVRDDRVGANDVAVGLVMRSGDERWRCAVEMRGRRWAVGDDSGW